MGLTSAYPNRSTAPDCITSRIACGHSYCRFALDIIAKSLSFPDATNMTIFSFYIFDRHSKSQPSSTQLAFAMPSRLPGQAPFVICLSPSLSPL